MKRATLLVALLVVALVPSLLRACERFANYDVVRPGTRFDGVYPHGTFCLKEGTARKLVRMLEATVHALDTIGVPYFLGAGSLLGWARHQGGIIPFDGSSVPSRAICFEVMGKRYRSMSSSNGMIPP